MTDEQLEMQFISLVFTFHQSAMFALGKMPNPMTGKVEITLPQAQNAVDILAMILEKTKGNLSEKEEKFLKNTLQELRLNYVYEVEQAGKKKEEAPSEAKEEPKEAANENEAETNKKADKPAK